MAYDEPTFRRHAADDPDRDTAAAFRTSTFATPDYRGRRRDSTGDFALDDAAGGSLPTAEPTGQRPAGGRDRLGVHLGWEAVLLVAAGGIGYLLFQLDGAAVRGTALQALLVSGAAIGLLALGAGVSLRAGVPNLALGPIAVAAGLQFADHGDRGLLSAAGPALGIAVAGAVVVAVLVVVLHVPGWAATLAAALGVVTFNQLHTVPAAVQGAYEPLPQAFLVFGGVAALAVIGGVLGTVPSVRRATGRLRPAGDPARRRGAGAALPVVGALVLSSAFAVGAGTLTAAAATGPVQPLTGLEWTGIALGTALVGGTSAYGRRGGVFGTLLAAVAVTLFLDYQARRDLDIALFAVAAALVAAGLAVTRLIESYGSDPAEADPEGADLAATWAPDTPETWSPATAAQQTPGRWDDDRWGGR